MEEKINLFIKDNQNNLNNEKLYNDFIKDKDYNSSELYVIKSLFDYKIENMLQMQNVLFKRKKILEKLKNLKLPEQRSKEWYEMRKDKLTASSIAAALNQCHFNTRDELILDKIIEKPFEANPITEWGVKYEDVAIMFYQELYNVKIIDFGMIPHPAFEAFGASPDGICDDSGNDEYVARMVEIKCPPKRKFTKTVPPHYLMQVQGQLEVCDLDHCDFFQVKIVEYENYQEYKNDIFEIEGVIQEGRTMLNYPKGVVATYKVEDKLSYEYGDINMKNIEIEKFTEFHSQKENIFEIKYWKIERYECTLVERNKEWWIKNINSILSFYNDLLLYKNDANELEKLKLRVESSKKRKKKIQHKPLNEFELISDDEN